MIRNVLAAAALGAVMVLAYGCGGWPSDRSTQQCNAEKQDRGMSCFDGKSYDTCVSCYEDCGTDCAPIGCPARYACPGDEPDTSSGSGGSGSGGGGGGGSK